MASAIILNIPHSSTVIPAPFKKLFTIEEPELYQELLNMTDWYTDELFDQGITGEGRSLTERDLWVQKEK